MTISDAAVPTATLCWQTWRDEICCRDAEDQGALVLCPNASLCDQACACLPLAICVTGSLPVNTLIC